MKLQIFKEFQSLQIFANKLDCLNLFLSLHSTTAIKE